MAILTLSGRTAFAIAVVAQPLHLAWGSGDPAWDAAAVPEPNTATGLVAELGRRAAALVEYCTPNSGGSIQVPQGNFAVSATPTNNIHLRFNFDYADAPAASIREVGVFLGTTIKAGTPAGQLYFQPSDLQSAGTLVSLQRLPKIVRSSLTRQSFDFVLTL